jgi:hypothetical protein
MHRTYNPPLSSVDRAVLNNVTERAEHVGTIKDRIAKKYPEINAGALDRSMGRLALSGYIDANLGFGKIPLLRRTELGGAVLRGPALETKPQQGLKRSVGMGL